MFELNKIPKIKTVFLSRANNNSNSLLASNKFDQDTSFLHYTLNAMHIPSIRNKYTQMVDSLPSSSHFVPINQPPLPLLVAAKFSSSV